jgi:hypothetical protein
MGNLGVTLDTLTISGTALIDVSAVVDVTLDDVVLDAAGDLPLYATLATLLGSLTAISVTLRGATGGQRSHVAGATHSNRPRPSAPGHNLPRNSLRSRRQRQH